MKHTRRWAYSRYFFPACCLLRFAAFFDSIWVYLALFDSIWICFALFDSVLLGLIFLNRVWLWLSVFNFLFVWFLLFNSIHLCFNFLEFVKLCLTPLNSRSYAQILCLFKQILSNSSLRPRTRSWLYFPPMQQNHVNPLTKPRQPCNITTSTL